MDRLPIRLLSWNLWHGLNPYQRVLMIPMESPVARRRRLKRQIEVLADWKNSPRDIICLQEVNPLKRQVRKLSAGLAMQGQGSVVNAGMKVARLGLPPFLEEGLATLSGSDFVNPKYTEITLSGQARELKGPFGVSVLLQLQERRKAFVFEAECQGRKLAVVNLHLHHGPDTVSENLERKKSEVEKLCQWLEPKLKEWDLIAVCGDFNCDANSVCVAPLLALGFQDAAKLAGVIQQPTWDPELNPIAGKSHRLVESPEVQAWDAGKHVFDRVYVRSSFTLESVHLSLIREPDLSDHFIVAVEIG